MKYKKIANCKVLADRILNFDLIDLKDKIRHNLKKLEDFFYESYKGFYCSLCDYWSHEFIVDTENSWEIIFSEKFCWDIVTSTLSTLLFFHIHLVKYTNLISKFLLSCDKKGDYEPNIQIPIDLIFAVSDEDKKHLLECRNEVNTLNWFIYCEKICEKF